MRYAHKHEEEHHKTISDQRDREENAYILKSHIANSQKLESPRPPFLVWRSSGFQTSSKAKSQGSRFARKNASLDYMKSITNCVGNLPVASLTAPRFARRFAGN